MLWIKCQHTLQGHSKFIAISKSNRTTHQSAAFDNTHTHTHDTKPPKYTIFYKIAKEQARARATKINNKQTNKKLSRTLYLCVSSSVVFSPSKHINCEINTVFDLLTIPRRVAELKIRKFAHSRFGTVPHRNANICVVFIYIKFDYYDHGKGHTV